MGLSGVQRTLKFVKYLPQFGWEPTVLTVDPVAYYAYDESLIEEVEEKGIEVVRTPAAGPGKYLATKEAIKLPSERTRRWLGRMSDTLFIPDNKIGWRKEAVAKAIGLHREKAFDLIFCTAPPFTSLLIGREIKEKINKPLVFDYRDPWVDSPFKFYATPLHKWRHIVLEREALRSSSHVVTTNRRVKELLLKRYRLLSYHDIDIISQGYDPEDFNVEPLEFSTNGHPRKMRITYAGIFWQDRTPETFFKALHSVLQEQPSLSSALEVIFVGTFREEHQKLIDQFGLRDIVTVTGYLPHRECIRYLLASDLLWMIVGDTVSSPGKLYEYLGSGKPVLGLAPDGFMKQAILEAGGTAVPPDDVDAIKQALLKYVQEYRNGTLKGLNREIVEKYNRVNLTGSLVRVFNSIFEP